MMLIDLCYETYTAVVLNKARTGLTMLGIIVGIASVIAMIAIGQGAQKNIESNIQAIGSNLLMILPGAQRGGAVSAGRGSAQTLTMADADAIQSSVSGIQAIAPEISRRYQMTVKSKNTNTQVVGTVAAYTAVRNLQIDQGTFITDDLVKKQSKVAVLGPTTKTDLFGEDTDAIGQTIRINKINFKVIGVTQTKGGTGFNNQDDMVFVPITTAMRFLSGSEYLSTISVQAVSQDVLSDVKQQATDVVLQKHKIADSTLADFSILNQADIVATASNATGIFTTLLAAIASISLLVGGIGIMNMMLTIVTERTREIGLRKAIGATRRDINLQFLTESILLTFLGGILGMLLGWLIAFGAKAMFGISASISLFSLLLAFGVSSGIGIVFGYYPAKRASKLNPIEALRYE